MAQITNDATELDVDVDVDAGVTCLNRLDQPTACLGARSFASNQADCH